MAATQEKVTMDVIKVVAAFVKNRAELLDPDVTEEFIIPPFFDGLMLQHDRKAIRIVGGRGCGKTMFLRYLSYQTQLSEHRGSISADIFGQGIGLYWKPDIGFCDLMQAEWLGDNLAKRAFTHHLAIVVLSEFASVAERLASITIDDRKIDVRRRPLPEEVRIVLPRDVVDYGALALFARHERVKLSHWVQNPDENWPTFFRVNELLESLADDLAASDPALSSLFIRVFVDEFENLKDDQRKLVCDLVKQPTHRYSFNFAMRRDSVERFDTSAGEQVVETHDFRTIDLEALFSDEETFKQMAAELLFLKLSKSQMPVAAKLFSVQRLHDQNGLAARKERGYMSDLKDGAKRTLPGLTSTEIASRVFDDEPLKRRLQLIVKKGLDRHNMTDSFSVDEFLRPDKPTASVVAAFVLNRQTPGPHAVLDALKTYSPELKRNNPFTDWIGNNLFGALFHLYLGLPQRPNPLYAGFESYCTITRPNLRFFLQYCQYALRDALLKEANLSVLAVPIEVQAEAAREASKLLLEQVTNLGLAGHDLQRLVKRLGRLFKYAHEREAQSEPEINHFSIDETDREQLTRETRELLRQAKIWTVLYEQAETKNKADDTTVQHDYVPNAIFSPHFGISYRKRRKLVLKAAEVNTICGGSDDAFEVLLREHRDKWSGVKRSGTGKLFDD